jgi:hypothetical protein
MKMTRRAGTPAALLAGLVLATSSLPLSAAQPDKAYLGGCVGFVTVRVADLAGKVGLEALAKEQPWLDGWKQSFGLPARDVARCTYVLLPDSGSAWVIRTVEPCPREALLKACLGEAKQVKREGHVCHVGRQSEVAVHFVNDRLVIVADKLQTLGRCLAAATDKPSLPKACTAALELADKHDVVLWTATRDKLSAQTGDQPRAHVPAQEAPNPAFQGPSELLLLPLPMPFGVESGTGTVDFGEKMVVELRLACADQGAARSAEKLMGAVVKMALGGLFLFSGQLELGECMAGANRAVMDHMLSGLPRKSLGQVEKALQHARLRTEGTEAVLTLTAALDAKMLQAELPPAITWLLSNANPRGKVSLPFFPASTASPPSRPAARLASPSQ